MRIFSSEVGDPMLLDNEEGLRAFGSELEAFLASAASAHSFPSHTSGGAEPYAQFLEGLRVEKVELLAPELQIGEDRWLALKASVPELVQLRERIGVLQDGDHTHLYASPISLVVEADDTWPS
ncbi:MAG: hypothetical protein KKB95_19795 [Gammaproteobacteria bacterium]|nr:hypothetical protein [Gammaproteobacteria bacterium]MBU2119044.1 hypothetical protein [Gammaproteobacteria bacterium]MBU2171818.1 hypothetical protein [Gammaproteobacteria bacterium]MBU2201235.1 hypothetical protein [Gammaproteobacteria bacterium]MBU2354805.1 hypothetical protein [Gammaproteobacteria bacterium]